MPAMNILFLLYKQSESWKRLLIPITHLAPVGRDVCRSRASSVPLFDRWQFGRTKWFGIPQTCCGSLAKDLFSDTPHSVLFIFLWMVKYKNYCILSSLEILLIHWCFFSPLFVFVSSVTLMCMTGCQLSLFPDYIKNLSIKARSRSLFHCKYHASNNAQVKVFSAVFPEQVIVSLT